ncbi:hypothetical protein HZS_3922 [Henneguya salminicola]|nr:hypothetical protein HZS_3922 [Henneguya salminicola]
MRPQVLLSIHVNSFNKQKRGARQKKMYFNMIITNKADNIKIKQCPSPSERGYRAGFIIIRVINLFLLSLIISLIIHNKLRTRDSCILR